VDFITPYLLPPPLRRLLLVAAAAGGCDGAWLVGPWFAVVVSAGGLPASAASGRSAGASKPIRHDHVMTHVSMKQCNYSHAASWDALQTPPYWKAELLPVWWAARKGGYFKDTCQQLEMHESTRMHHHSARDNRYWKNTGRLLQGDICQQVEQVTQAGPIRVSLPWGGWMTVQQHTMRDKGTMAASGRTLSVRRPASRHGMQTKTAQPAPTARWD